MKKTQFCVSLLTLFHITLLGFSSIGMTQMGTWTQKADMPTARFSAPASAVNGRIYVIGGAPGGWGFSSAVEKYDPMTDTWTSGADMPTARQSFSTNVVNGKIYAIGGWAAYNSLRVVEEYDPARDTWTSKLDMPTARCIFAASVVDGKIYVIGGGFVIDGNTSTEVFSIMEMYDPATDTWIKKADMPTPRVWFCSSVVNGRIYAIGGSTEIRGGVPSGQILSTVEEYDPVNDTWTRKADMPTSRTIPSACAVDGRIYVIGGENPAKLSVVEVYDPVTDTWWREANTLFPVSYHSNSVVNGYIYVIGGSSTSSVGIPSVMEYDTGFGVRATVISPQEGLVAGGGKIAIFGSGYSPGAIATIGEEPLSDLEVTDTLITGIIPPGMEGEQDIWISVPNLSYPVFAGTFFYYTDSGIIVRSMEPTNGRQAGGELGSISGEGFLPGASVTIGGVPASDVNAISTFITFIIPPGEPGTKYVVVTNPDGGKGTLRKGYTYNPFPVIEKVRPVDGPMAGGTAVTITGNHFMEGIAVYIDEQRIFGLDFLSSQELHFVTPPGTVGAKTIRVVNQDGQEAIWKYQFTYNPPPTISSVEPDAGPLEGGTMIVITGTGFIRSVHTRILVGDIEATRWSNTLTEIIAKTPPNTSGPKDVIVINGDGHKATLTNAFTYNLAPVITKVIPDNGRLAGGTEIIIQGSGFLPGAKVLFSTETGAFMAAPSAQAMSATIITAVTPPGEPGPKDVAVRNTDGQRIILPDGFAYNPLPTITHITPNNGGSSGGTKIIIEGTGFLHGVRVAVGGNAGTAQLQDENTIQVITPSNPPGIWDVRVLNPDTQEVTAKGAFISVGEIVYNFPNPFRASQGTTFRYMTRHQVQYMTIKIFNLSGSPIDALEIYGSNEVKWLNPKVHIGLYVYLMEAELENGERKQFRSMLEVYK